ncbi:hypothetical protein MJO28_011442 [Puccinia striiformis f. sp. tritici]|uniref:Uncharacterized protein n=1 Tax=Puccinia striiformis f. sp. tritici TaxID=168172 RepID=A0ACC0E3Q9_9BASI|nr:hypothetical protein MJO28_011442 [Puccinia striiformis f. sp. tritici]
MGLSWAAIFQGKTAGNGLDVGHLPCQTPAGSTVQNRTPVQLYQPIMNSHTIRSLYLVFCLVNQVGLALLGPIKTKGKEVLLNLIEPPAERTRFDSNAVPPEEPSIISLSSDLPSSPNLLFGVDLNLPRERMEPGSIVSTHDFVPICHYPSSASKRKFIDPNVDSIVPTLNLFPPSHYASSSSKRKLLDQGIEQSGTSKERQKSVSKQQDGVKNQGTANSAQLKQINLSVSMRRSEDTLHVPTYLSREFDSISSSSELLDMYDWNWIIVDPSAEKASETQKKPGELNNSQNVFKCLNSLRREPLSGRIFWIPEGDEHAYLQDFHGQRGNNDMIYPPVSDFTPSQRQSGIIHIITRIADCKLDLERYMNCFSDVWVEMKSRIDVRNKTAYQVENALQQRISYLKKITKVSTTLSVFYLSLFGRHEGGRLEKLHIEDFMEFIKAIFKQCGEDQALLLTCNGDFSKIWHTLLNFGSTSSSASKDLALAWRTVEYWLDKTGQRSRFEIGTYHPDAVEIINKIIFWSNYKTIEGITTSKREKRTKQNSKH